MLISCLTQAWAVSLEEVETAVCSVVGAGQTNEHVHEGREELGGEKVTAGCDELVQAQLPLKGPVTPKICIQIRCYRCYLPGIEANGSIKTHSIRH